jgi:hypothetical protein
MWVLPASLSPDQAQQLAGGVRNLDRSRPIGQLLEMSESARDCSADILFMPLGHRDLNVTLTRPVIVIHDSATSESRLTMQSRPSAQT